MIFSESLRLYPPTWLYIRMANSDDRLPGGAFIPAGTKLYISQYVSHRNPLYFPEPEKFEPNRFSETGKQGRPPFAYFPFGGGPRVCIGEHFAKLQAILVLAVLHQRFRFELEPGQIIEPYPGITLTPKHGIRMRVQIPAGIVNQMVKY
jgi:cytochrome P450